MAHTKNPAAVELGRKGGAVKGVAKGFASSKLTAEERSAAASDAARARWAKAKKTAKAGKNKR